MTLFRKNQKPLHSRWGDIAISSPTDGSWNQHQHQHQKQSQGPDQQHIDSRTASFSRRLSRRLSLSRGPGYHHERDCQPLIEEKGQAQSQFAYKPISQDYPSEVAETRDLSSRFRYIPARATYDEEFERARARSVGCGMVGEEEEVGGFGSGDGLQRRNRDRRGVSYPGYGYGYGYGYGSDGYGCESVLRPESGWMVGRRGSSSPSPSPSMAKKRNSTRRMTMTMVPDAEEIYG